MSEPVDLNQFTPAERVMFAAELQVGLLDRIGKTLSTILVLLQLLTAFAVVGAAVGVIVVATK